MLPVLFLISHGSKRKHKIDIKYEARMRNCDYQHREHSRRGLCKSRCYLTIYLDAGRRSKLDYDAFNMRMISR